MKVAELIEKLQAMPLDADVVFDTEAAQFHVHMVSVDSAFYEEEPRPHCSLHTKEPREYAGARERRIVELTAALQPFANLRVESSALDGPDIPLRSVVACGKHATCLAIQSKVFEQVIPARYVYAARRALSNG